MLTHFYFHLNFLLLLLIWFSFVFQLFADTSGYYFAAPNTQTRFVPSAAFQSNRQPAPAAYLSATRGGGNALSNGAYTQPGSYQEQLLFISNDGKQQQSQQPASSAAYSPFGAQISVSHTNPFLGAKFGTLRSCVWIFEKIEIFGQPCYGESC